MSSEIEQTAPEVIRPKLLTAPCARFFDFDDEIAHFFAFFIQMSKRPDEMMEDLMRVLHGDDSQELKEFLAAPKAGAANLKRFARFLMEMMMVRGVDNFLTYVSELLALIFTSRPETLKSGETVKVEEILQYETMDDLVRRLAERRVERLSYQGMKELQHDLADKMGFGLFLTVEPLSRAVRIIEIRNLIVHNRGVVNRIFQTRSGDTSAAIGETIKLSPRAVVSDLIFLGQSVADIDERAATKFGLTRSESQAVGTAK